MAVPDWVPKDFFQNALKKFFNNKNVTVYGFTSSAAVAAGDNYASDLFRTCITYGTGQNGNKETISVILKCSPEGREQIMKLVQEIRLFDKEAEMFMTTLPTLCDVIGEPWSLSATFLHFTKKPCPVIMLEDLTQLGFKMHNRQEGFDLQHCLLVVEKIACLHAASIVMHKQDPTAFENYSEGLYSSNPTIVDWVVQGFDSLTRACLRWKGLEKYGEKLAALKDKIVQKALEAGKCNPKKFNVLNHGDCWVNNFMFAYTPEGKLKDFRFVDFQMVFYSSPAIDLHYFWATSPKIEVHRKYLETILDRYYAQLLSNLTKFHCSLANVPTRKEFRNDWNTRAFYGLIAAATVLPLVKANKRDDAKFEDLMAGEDEASFRYHIYNNERYLKHMEFLLPFFDDLGVLDI